ncbi:MAG: DUF4266 domain-containing protein [Inhella sp.]
MSRSRPLLFGFGLAVWCGLSACTTVAPWERGVLAKPQMAVDPSPMRSSWRNHVEGSRQAARSGSAAQGGGCGCN